MIKRQTEKYIKYLKLLFLFFIVVSVLIFYWFNFLSFFSSENLILKIENFGFLGVGFYIFLMALAIVISPIPSLPLAGISGIVFGVFWGTVYSVVGGVIGAVVAFLIGRFLGRDYVIDKFGKKGLFLEKYSENELSVIIFVMRLFPFFQFDVVSYGAGLTKIRVWKFFVTTFFGMIPMTYLFVRSGELVFSSNVVGLVFVLVIILGMYFGAKYVMKK